MWRGVDVGRGWVQGERGDYVNEIKGAGFAAVEFLSRLLPLLLLSSPSLSLCAAWVILFRQHPWLPGRGTKPSDTNKTQTKTLDVPCTGPWARAHQTLTLSLSLPPFSIHLVSLSLTFIHAHSNSESVGIITFASTPEYRAAERHMDNFVVLWN